MSDQFSDEVILETSKILTMMGQSTVTIHVQSSMVRQATKGAHSERKEIEMVMASEIVMIAVFVFQEVLQMLDVLRIP